MTTTNPDPFLPRPPPVATRRRALALAAILGLALTMRLPVLAERQLVEGDGVHYALLARQALTGNFSALANPYWSNLWPAVIAGTSLVTGLDVVGSGRFASLLLGIALCLATALLGEKLFGPFQGMLAGLAVALHPWLVAFSTLVFTESCFSLLVVALLLASYHATRSAGPSRAAVVGVVGGLALLTRPEAFGVIGVVAFVITAAAWRRGGIRCATASAAALLLVAASFLTARALLVHHYRGEWDLGLRYKATTNLFAGLADTDVARERIIHEVTADGVTRLEASLRNWTLDGFALAHRRLLIAHVAKNLVLLASSARRVFPPLPVSMGREAFRGTVLWTAIDVAAVFCLGVAFLGLLHGLRAPETRLGATLCGAVLCVQVLGLAPLFVHDRMIVTSAPLFLLLFAHGLALLAARLVPALARSLAGSIFLLPLAALSLHGLLRAPTLDYASEPLAQKEAGLWLRGHFPQGVRLMTLAPSIAFYFYDVEHQDQAVDLPWAEFPALLEYARKREVDVIAAPEWQMLAAGVPSAPQLGPKGGHPGLSYLATLGEPPTCVHFFRVERDAQSGRMATPRRVP